MTTFSRSIFTVHYPYTNAVGGKLRPALALTELDSNGDAWFAFISSQEKNAEFGLQVPSQYLPRPSWLLAQKSVLLNRSAIFERITIVDDFFYTQAYKAVALHHAKNFSHHVHLSPKIFIPGTTVVPYAGRVFDTEEVAAGVGSMLDFWLTLGKEGDAFEKELAPMLGVQSTVLVNSGSSANLLAVAALTSHKLGERRLKPGDEIITAAAGFPTTVAPMIQHGCVPVFIDVDPLTANAKVEQLEDAYVHGKTKAVMFAHTLGNAFDLSEVTRFCKEKDIWLIEDNCDALGTTYDSRWTGSFGDISTQSFYPPHHLTLGEGGAVNIVRDSKLRALVESFRDWGRDCWCHSGYDDTCHRRFDWQLGDLPVGYDHKYIYSHLGYNLKPLDVQAAIGRAQLKKLPRFIQTRRDNWLNLRTKLSDLEDVIDFMLPTHAANWTSSGFSWMNGKAKVDPSWFGFMMLVKPGSGFSRTDLARALDTAKIGNRMLFGGNLVRQPAFVTLRQQTDGKAFRVIGDLAGSDRIMNDCVFVGTYPGLTPELIEYISKTVHAFVRK